MAYRSTKLHLASGGYSTNAAMMLFSKDSEKWQPGAYVKIVYFETDSDLIVALNYGDLNG